MRNFILVALTLAAGTASAAGVTVSFSNKPDPTWTRFRGGTVAAPRDTATGQHSGKRAVSTLIVEAPGTSATAALAGIAEKAAVTDASYTAAGVPSGKRVPWTWRLSWPASAETLKAVSSWFGSPAPKDMTVQFSDGRSLVLANCTPYEWVPLAMATAPTSTQLALSCQTLKKPADKASPGWHMVEATGAPQNAANKGETVVVSAGNAAISWSTCAFHKWELVSEAGPPARTVEALNLACAAAVPAPPSKQVPTDKAPTARAPGAR